VECPPPPAPVPPPQSVGPRPHLPAPRGYFGIPFPTRVPPPPLLLVAAGLIKTKSPCSCHSEGFPYVSMSYFSRGCLAAHPPPPYPPETPPAARLLTPFPQPLYGALGSFFFSYRDPHRPPPGKTFPFLGGPPPTGGVKKRKLWGQTRKAPLRFSPKTTR